MEEQGTLELIWSESELCALPICQAQNRTTILSKKWEWWPYFELNRQIDYLSIEEVECLKVGGEECQPARKVVTWD